MLLTARRRAIGRDPQPHRNKHTNREETKNHRLVPNTSVGSMCVSDSSCPRPQPRTSHNYHECTLLCLSLKSDPCHPPFLTRPVVTATMLRLVLSNLPRVLHFSRPARPCALVRTFFLPQVLAIKKMAVSGSTGEFCRSPVWSETSQLTPPSLFVRHVSKP